MWSSSIYEEWILSIYATDLANHASENEAHLPPSSNLGLYSTRKYFLKQELRAQLSQIL